MPEDLQSTNKLGLNAVVLLNGGLTNIDSIRPYLGNNSLFIAADGGIKHAEIHEFPVHTIVGDLDSAAPSLVEKYLAGGTKLLRFPTAKDATDLELAIEYASSLGAQTIHLLGIEGGRSDHLLGIYTILAHQKFSALTLWAYDADSRIIALQGGTHFELNTRHGARLSLIALSPTVTGLTLSGTRWELEKATIQLGDSLTISNVTTSTTVNISVDSGAVVLVSER